MPVEMHNGVVYICVVFDEKVADFLVSNKIDYKVVEVIELDC